MLIKDWMAKDPVTITEDTSMIKSHSYHEGSAISGGCRLVDQGKLVGMVTDGT